MGAMDRTLVLDHRQVAELLDMPSCIEAVRDALVALSTGAAVQPLRGFMWLPDRRGLLAAMPAHLDPIGTMGSKIISVFPGNTDTPYDSHQGVVLLFETDHGRLLAILDASELTAIRTAAASAVATDLLARPDAERLAILGTGTQALTHLEAIPVVREIGEIRIWGRNPDKAAAIAEAAEGPVEAVATVEEAVADADVICTVTAATEPILEGRWVAPGAHVNLVGSAMPTAREADTDLVVRARVFTDRLESVFAEAGDVVIPLEEGAIDRDHVLGEIGAVAAGLLEGRRTSDEVTVFKSLGVGVEDVAAGRLVYDRAVARGVGTPVALGGLRPGLAGRAGGDPI